MGPEVAELERADGAFRCGHVISCSSGTDALMLGLMALELKPGDAVIVPSFTFAASAEVLPALARCLSLPRLTRRHSISTRPSR